MASPSYFLSNHLLLETLDFRVMWSIKLAMVAIIGAVLVTMVIAKFSRYTTGVTVMGFLTTMIFYCMSFVWRDAYTDATYGTLAALWGIYSFLVVDGDELLNPGFQISRDILCYLLIFCVQIRSYISANLTRMKTSAVESDYRFLLTSVCFDPRNMKFYDRPQEVDLDATPSILGVFALGLQRVAELLLPLIMILPAQHNGIYNSSRLVTVLRVVLASATYMICDRAFPPDDRLKDCNVQAVALPTFMAFMVNPYMLVVTGFNCIALLIAASRNLPVTASYRSPMTNADV